MKTIRTTIKALFVCTLMTFALLQNIYADTPPRIEMRATAERQVTPNEIYVSITARESNYKGKKTLPEIQEIIIKVLKKNNIDVAKNLTINDMGSSISYKIFSSKVHPRSEATYQVKFDDASIMQKVIYELENEGISNIALVRTKYTNDEALITELGVEAIKKAQAQASAYAGAVGQQIGKAININSWTSQNSIEPRMYKSRSMNTVALEEADNTVEQQVSIGKITYNVTVTVVFELK